MSRSDHDPVTDPGRLLEIADLHLTSGEVDEILQQIVDEAAERFDLPVSLVSIVLDEAQFFAGMRGLDGWIREARGTPLEWSFCTNVVRDEKAFIVEDATLDPKVRDIPLVDFEGIRCYAGVPLRSSRGHVLGSLCVIGPEPRKFTADEIDALRQLADRAIERIETRRDRTE